MMRVSRNERGWGLDGVYERFSDSFSCVRRDPDWTFPITDRDILASLLWNNQ